jgi:hypothetical protein
MKLKTKLDRIRKLYPKGPTANGQIFSGRFLPTARFKKVTLYTLFVSDENTHLLRPHVFETHRGRTATQWSAWFAAKLTDIHIASVLPGLGIRTDKSWSVKRILGWSAGNAQHRIDSPRVARKGHKTKSSRGKNGQVRVRRGHRNRRRKTK